MELTRVASRCEPELMARGRHSQFAPRGQVALVAVALAAAAATSSAESAGAPLLPDLVSTPVQNLHTQVRERRVLLRFDSYIQNAGPGSLELRAQGPKGSDVLGTLRMTRAEQVLRDEAGEVAERRPSAARFSFESTDGHRHWHVQAAQRLTLVTADGLTPVAPGAKIGFCLSDIGFSPTSPPSVLTQRYRGCFGRTADGSMLSARTASHASEVTVGIQADWQDFYQSSLPFQWIDLSGVVAPGRYRVRDEVDPDGVVVEHDEANRAAYSRRFSLRGWRPRPLVAPPRAPGVRQRLRLRALRVVGTGLPRRDRYAGAPAPARFELVRAPKRGRVMIAPRGGVAVYVPRTGFRGRDGFTFTAAEAGTLLARPLASVALTVGRDSIRAP